MYRFEKTANHQKMLAAALVAMLAICSFACVFSDDASAVNNNGETYDIYMRTGDVFSYAPDTNLADAKITLSGTAYDNDSLNWTNGTLEQVSNSATEDDSHQIILGSFDAANSTAYTLLLTANWTNGTLNQSATQNINFHIYDRIQFTGASTHGNYTEDADGITFEDLPAQGQAIDTISIATQGKVYGTNPTWGSASFTFNGGADNGLLTFDSSTGEIKVNKTVTAEEQDTYDGQYVMTVKASYTSNGVTDEATYTYTIDIGTDLTVTGGTLQTYVGNTDAEDGTFTIETNHDGKGIQFTYEVSDDSGVSGLIQHSGANSNTFSIKTDAAGLADFIGSSESKTVNVTVTVSGNIDDDEDVETATTTVSVTIFAALVFTTEPTIENNVIESATGNPEDALASAKFAGAKSITYNWGDGTQTHVDVKNTSNPTYAARHVYDSPGTYLVTITAENDVGTQKAYMLYDATNGAWAAADETTETGDNDKGFFEEHGYLFILFAILALLMVVVFFGVGIQHPFVAIAAIAFVILAVLCFLYDDFGLLDGFLDGES